MLLSFAIEFTKYIFNFFISRRKNLKTLFFKHRALNAQSSQQRFMVGNFMFGGARYFSKYKIHDMSCATPREKLFSTISPILYKKYSKNNTSFISMKYQTFSHHLSKDDRRAERDRKKVNSCIKGCVSF